MVSVSSSNLYCILNQLMQICQKDVKINNTYYPIGIAGSEKIYTDIENGLDVTYLFYMDEDRSRYLIPVFQIDIM